METYLGFLAGQLLAIGYQWAHWKQAGENWLDYWRNGHRARHLADVILSVVVLLGWKSGALLAFAEILGIKEWASKLPTTPEGLAASTFAGFVMAFAVRAIENRFSPRKPG